MKSSTRYVSFAVVTLTVAGLSIPFHRTGMEMLEPFAAATELEVLFKVGVSQSTRFKVKSAPQGKPSVKFAMKLGFVVGVK